MSKYFNRRSPNDWETVVITEQWQITFWTQHLTTTQDKLTRALKEAGPRTQDVIYWLESEKNIKKQS